MPIGTYSNKPATPGTLYLSDATEFVLALLKDITTESANRILQTAFINFENIENLSDLNAEDSDVKLLIAFRFANEDPRNVNLASTLQDNGENIKVVFEIGFVCLQDTLDSIDFLRAVEEVITACTNNWNGETPQPRPYTVVLSNKKTLSSNLKTNESDSFQMTQIAEEDKQQPNYLTANINVVFSIVNNT